MNENEGNAMVYHYVSHALLNAKLKLRRGMKEEADGFRAGLISQLEKIDCEPSSKCIRELKNTTWYDSESVLAFQRKYDSEIHKT